MDLNLYLGFPRSSLRSRGGGLGSDLVLGSPIEPPIEPPPEPPLEPLEPVELFPSNWPPYHLLPDRNPSEDGGPGLIFGGDDDEPESRIRRIIELQERIQTQRSLQFSRGFAIPEPAVEEAAADDEKGGGKVEFECNICLDLAREPVVTSCGHLFCWPCLYQWLHLHSTHRECPVCKGEVVESTITPVYGRGGGPDRRRVGDDDVAIPPRPRARRVDSWRQRIRRPLSRRFSVGVSSAWRRFLGDDIVETSLHETINSAHRRVTPRLRARRPAPDPLNEGSSVVGVQELGVRPIVERVDLPSASSTMGVIHGAGSSRGTRGRGRSGNPVDLDDGPIQGRKRRRTD